MLVEASQKSSVFAPTFPFSPDKLAQAGPGRQVVKGDGFSSRQVAITGSELAKNILEDARIFPDEFVLQPRLSSSPLPPTLAFDTSADKLILLMNPNCKLNVWIINNQPAGIMASLSEQEIISDKDYNTIPVPYDQT